MLNSRTWMILGIVVAGICLIRVLTVAAAPRSPSDDVEVYSATENNDDSDTRSTEDSRAEIRLTRPGEAESRIADDQGYDQVPGIERLQARERSNEIQVPTKRDRRIASEAALPPSPVAPREESAPLSAEPIEPKPFTSADARERASESRRETIVASSNPGASRSLGLKSEPGPDTQIEPPTPSSAVARSGVQEVSLIVSDYGYFPNRVFVTQNVPVKIYMTTPSKVTMCFMLDSIGVKKGVIPGKVEEVSFTPDQPGNFRFYCPVKSIEGTLTVREAPLAEQSSRGVASEKPDTAGVRNEPKNAAQLRSLIED